MKEHICTEVGDYIKKAYSHQDFHPMQEQDKELQSSGIQLETSLYLFIVYCPSRRDMKFTFAMSRVLESFMGVSDCSGLC